MARREIVNRRPGRGNGKATKQRREAGPPRAARPATRSATAPRGAVFENVGVTESDLSLVERRRSVVPITKPRASVKLQDDAPKESTDAVAVEGGAPAVELLSEERIRRRAYELYLVRNGNEGDVVSDWLLAECELRARPS